VFQFTHSRCHVGQITRRIFGAKVMPPAVHTIGELKDAEKTKDTMSNQVMVSDVPAVIGPLNDAHDQPNS